MLEDTKETFYVPLSDVLVLGFIFSTVQFARYSVNPTKSSSQPVVLSPYDATVVMSAVTDSSNKFFFMTIVSSRQEGLVGSATAVHSLLLSPIGT